MLLGNLLLALAWTALQRRVLAREPRDRTGVGVLDSLGHWSRAGYCRHPHTSAGFIAQSVWRRFSSGSSFARTFGWRSMSQRRATR